MNYAIIQEDAVSFKLFRPVKCKKIKIDNKNILFLNLKYKYFLPIVLKFFKIDKYFFENNVDEDAIIKFLLTKYKSISICASPDKILEILKLGADYNIDFYLPYDNPYIAMTALRKWGITVFVSKFVTAELILYFDGVMPNYGANTFVTDFSGIYRNNLINTNFINDISFKTYSTLKKIIPGLNIKAVH